MVQSKRVIVVWLVLGALSVLIGCGPAFETPTSQPALTSQEQPAEHDIDREVVNRLSRYFAEAAEAGEFSGVALFARNEQVLFHRAYGLASRRYNVANTVHTRFNLASASKMLTAVVIAQLVEQGQLSYEDRIGSYLSPHWVSEEVGEKVRIKHLLSHTSGLGHYWDEWDCYGNTIRTLAGYKQLISDDLAFEPGTSGQYSNTGFLLLGVIIEKVTGRSYYDVVRDVVLEPSGMADAGFYEIDEPHPNLATGYFQEGRRIKNNLLLHGVKGSSAGGAWSTAADLHRFFLALEADRLVSAETREVLWTPKPMSARYGYGFQTTGGWVGHGGGFPGISALVRYYPDSGHTVIVLSNYSGPALQLEELLEILSKLGQN
jgi:CubicO group peptidase (beta-lactamase class C family)